MSVEIGECFLERHRSCGAVLDSLSSVEERNETLWVGAQVSELFVAEHSTHGRQGDHAMFVGRHGVRAGPVDHSVERNTTPVVGLQQSGGSW